MLASSKNVQSPEIQFQGQRAQVLHTTLGDLADIAESLEAAARRFPNSGIGEGEIHPQFTVEGFCHVLKQKVYLLISMADRTEHIDFPKLFDRQEGK